MPAVKIGLDQEVELHQARDPNMSPELTINGRASPSHPVETLRCYDRKSGAVLIADDRTFDPATMQLDEPDVA